MKEFFVTTTATITRTYKFHAEDELTAKNLVNGDCLRPYDRNETPATIVSCEVILPYKTGSWFTIESGSKRMIIEDHGTYNTISDKGKIQIGTWKKSIADLLKCYPDIVEE